MNVEFHILATMLGQILLMYFLERKNVPWGNNQSVLWLGKLGSLVLKKDQNPSLTIASLISYQQKTCLLSIAASTKLSLSSWPGRPALAGCMQKEYLSVPSPLLFLESPQKISPHRLSTAGNGSARWAYEKCVSSFANFNSQFCMESMIWPTALPHMWCLCPERFLSLISKVGKKRLREPRKLRAVTSQAGFCRYNIHGSRVVRGTRNCKGLEPSSSHFRLRWKI